MTQDDDPRPGAELATRTALVEYLEGRVALAELMDWLATTFGGPTRARTAPDLACRIVARVERHLAALREDLRRLYVEDIDP